jgi:sRNA-binding protein
MLRIGLLTVCAAALLSTAVVYADVFKYVDEKGNVQYTDRPAKLPAQRLNIQSQRTDTVELSERVDNDSKSVAEREKARQQADKAKTDKKKADESSEVGKAEACNKARTDYLNRMNAQRLYEDLPNGERRYLTDAELDASRESSKKAMDALCN